MYISVPSAIHGYNLSALRAYAGRNAHGCIAAASRSGRHVSKPFAGSSNVFCRQCRFIEATYSKSASKASLQGVSSLQH